MNIWCWKTSPKKLENKPPTTIAIENFVNKFIQADGVRDEDCLCSAES